MSRGKCTVVPEFAYLKVKLISDSPFASLADARTYKSVVLSSVHSLLGEVGLPGDVDVLGLLGDGSAILRCPFDKLEPLWSALTLTTGFDGESCRFEVQQSSGSLLSLHCSSSRFQNSGENVWEAFVLR
mmetsp:Transcript_45091/g.70680  ORF Transcript_45091/g.70680 Transcript_45091/m.70680 type:complete len:129 (-) Transcript_45091:292-678(-)